ncbi:NAD-dependent succinate-semialdehyde dehydrogenase [Paenarthrobacter sp. TYUT067]|uniref:NAD-dependent succinate-semialdehyde dehydrogenase n=1 Tax=Paenarthrobacter sp. TYUT067 TaxID=2926245 RepID=UPI0020302BCD|nr:NAD-dependent succinate-semialdehyde dehydrogenase [Paenarthrobacter sp. TYUT067]MCM0616846.1 NAD-dependent succinate-semialdehyde dehydrogenase [Paenarthrobacter sp. TYUT067]
MMLESVTRATTLTMTDPSTGEELKTYPSISRDRLDGVLAAATAAQRDWRRTSVAERIEPLRRLAELLRTEAEQHAEIISTEMGKPVSEAIAEVLKCATACDYYADHAEEFLAPKAVETNAERSYISYEPIGVVLAVMPWNFPYWQVIRFAAPTLTAGNGGLLKHASNVTGCSLALQDIIERAGFPNGLFTSLVLSEHALVNEIIADRRVAAVTLTGSEAAGANVAEAAGRALKKTVLELGGSDPFVILGDAPIPAVVPNAVKARFGNAGQSCLCAKRIIVEEPAADEFERLVVPAVEALQVGSPLDPATQIGPLAKPSFVDDIDRQVQDSIAMGARLLTGGKRIPGPGNYYAPTVLADVTPDMPVFREETFGPVMAIIRAGSPEQAAIHADDTQYGLGASVWTADVAKGLRLGADIESGALFVNGVVASDPRLPFGGTKLSGYGRELSVEGMREFTNVRSVWTASLSVD